MNSTVIYVIVTAIITCILTLIGVFARTYSGTLSIYTGDDLEKDIFRYDLAISLDDLAKKKFILMITKTSREKNDLYDD